ncbi:hypothetical protein L1887_10936 [Cichorium endivia]|nr:hypothetical protein L1887_10936 [Cichorium endivia]
MRLIKERKQQENVKVQDDEERHQIMEEDTTSAKKLLDDLFAHLALKGCDENIGIVLEEFKYSSDEFADVNKDVSETFFYYFYETEAEVHVYAYPVHIPYEEVPRIDSNKSKNLFKEPNRKLDMMTDALNKFIISSGNFVQSSSSSDALNKLVNQSFVKVFDQLKDIQRDMSAMWSKLVEMLLLRVYPKLTMEVSKETWVCSAHFIRHHYRRKLPPVPPPD